MFEDAEEDEEMMNYDNHHSLNIYETEISQKKILPIKHIIEDFVILEHPYEDSEEENNAQPDPIHKALERKFEASVDNQTPKSTTKSYYKKVPPKEIVYNNNNYEEINRERYQIPQRMNENRPKVEEIGPSTVPTPNMNFQQSMEPNHYTQTIEQKNSHNLPSMHTVIEKTKENSFENQRGVKTINPVNNVKTMIYTQPIPPVNSITTLSPVNGMNNIATMNNMPLFRNMNTSNRITATTLP